MELLRPEAIKRMLCHARDRSSSYELVLSTYISNDFQNATSNKYL